MRIGIQRKISGLLFLSLLAIGFSIGIAFYFKYTDYMMRSVVDRLHNGLFSIYNIVDIEGLPELKKESNHSPEYIKNWKKIKSIQKELRLAYIYIVLMNEKNQFYFTYDTGEDPTKSGPDDNYFRIYNDAPSEAFESFASGKMIVVKGQYTNKQGTFQSAFYPIRVNGKIIGVIGADCNILDILELKKQAMFTIVFVLFLGLMFVILFRIIVQRWIVNPIIALNDGSRKIANGNLDYVIVVFQNDEIGDLAKSFNIMLRNLKANFATIQRRNEKLEERVEERTEELRSTFATIQELKNQQDEDYFLTTLISSPLMQNRNKSPFVKIDFLIEQRKKFQFRGKTYSLGGDISIAGNLNFFGRPFTMFFNGDAMGKSMQGASGALVIGSVVNSIMSRSAANKRVITKDPDRWLRETFFEIQKVMEAFEGAMLVTCILGVIDDETGLLQFFNTEHPLSVIYRNGKASFIEHEITMHKLGIPLNTEVDLFQFQLQPGDVILCGSDGKDDLILNGSVPGINITNEDPKLFLNIVEVSDGQLEQIYKNLLSKGELSDDLSVVRISYKETTMS
jgi:HAMP domain-containing protein